MWGNNENFYIFACLSVKNIVREAWDAIAANIGWKFNFVAVWGGANIYHGFVKRIQVARTQACLLGFVICHMF